MTTFEIATRNVLRNRRRSLLTAVALVVGTWATLLFGGYVGHSLRALETDTVRDVGHLQIVRKDYLDFGRGDPGHYSIADYESLIAKIRGDATLAKMITVVTPILKVEGVAGNFAANLSTSFSGQGVVPRDFLRQQAWDGFQLGFEPTPSSLRESASDGGVVGFQLAQLLSLCAPLHLEDCKVPSAKTAAKSGDALPADIAALAASASTARDEGPVAIDLLAASPSGLPNVVRLHLLGAERQSIREIDSTYVAMPFRLAQRLVFGPTTKAASAIVVQLSESRMMPAATERLNALLQSDGSLEVLTFHDVSPVFDQIVASFRALFLFIAILMGLVALFSVANTVNMAVGERIGEIGTLRSLGFQRSFIRRVFIIEGAVIGLFGSIAGAVTAVALAFVINGSHLTWTPPGHADPVALRVDVLANPALIAFVVIGLSLVACVSALWPAHQAAKLEVTEALRHV